MNTSQSELETNGNVPAQIKDGCPAWASEMIHKIMLLEIEAGTIKNPAETQSTEKWTTAQLEELAKMANRMDHQGYQELANGVEALFTRIARGLVSEGHTPEAIAQMVNIRIPTGCRLPYCSADEVRDALQH